MSKVQRKIIISRLIIQFCFAIKKNKKTFSVHYSEAAAFMFLDVVDS